MVAPHHLSSCPPALYPLSILSLSSLYPLPSLSILSLYPRLLFALIFLSSPPLFFIISLSPLSLPIPFLSPFYPLSIPSLSPPYPLAVPSLYPLCLCILFLFSALARGLGSRYFSCLPSGHLLDTRQGIYIYHLFILPHPQLITVVLISSHLAPHHFSFILSYSQIKLKYSDLNIVGYIKWQHVRSASTDAPQQPERKISSLKSVLRRFPPLPSPSPPPASAFISFYSFLGSSRLMSLKVLPHDTP